MMTIGITGASGALGRATAKLVLQSVDPGEVVLTTRHPESLADFADRGVVVRPADFSDAGTLPRGFAGLDRLLLISTDSVGVRLEQQRAAIAAAAAAGVRHVIYTSIPQPVSANPAGVVPDHAGTEEALQASGLAWTMLRNNLYAHYQVPGLQQAVASGRLVTNTGDGAAAYVTREDCAAAAAAVLTSDGHEGQTYDVTGPEALSAADLVTLARGISGRDVELVAVEDAAFAAGLRSAGMPAAAADLLTSFGASTRLGYLAHVSTAVTDLTGRRPTRLANVVREA